MVVRVGASASAVRAAAMSRPQQGHGRGVLGATSRAPVARAVDGELGDAVLADVGAKHLPARPVVPVPVPVLLELQRETGRCRVEPPAWNAPRPGVATLAQRDEVLDAGRL